ncbi:MAG: DHA2 family efflux MFS transporter permease subunit [Dokdonella sp.]|uniref:DHA2 family efflux MFS transporter permease subunit n=1 Tax=Dokdonella sp. TaxID=2291710 RepID=UPI0025BC230D|nr:DHA2 family efflux MFS transporter permease subunit [Dokdonella sp.]MBX3702015.1 DHA2 family efflux MFS transporter permease subunit [Dokdonella sp.]MCW5578603.1 DHA2 family efflux MFS transporter permease subunit [Dokdonella sp.]
MSAAPVSHREVANRGLLVVSVMLTTLMQALDTTIANVALPNMQGSLAATQDQIAWVLTSYIVAAAIATPATGWLASIMGRRRLLLIAIAGFTIASVLCGLATGIGAMVAFRLLQGLFGASLVPLSQSTLLDVYPREKHGSAMALWGMGVMVGPILGPPLGGWLTETWSWHWVFFINVPVGILALLGVAASLPSDDTRRTRFDWRGFAFLAVGVGALQLFLDRGELLDWWNSSEIRIELALACLGFYLYAVHWKFSRTPFVDLGLFADRNFLASNILIFVVGIVLFATMALLPPYMQNLMGYPVIATGVLLAPRGVGTLLAMLVVGRLLARGADARLVAAVGMLLTALSLWQMTGFNLDVPQSLIIETGILQGIGIGLVFVPISTVAYSTLPMAVRTEAAGIYSLTRNIGSSVGISIVMALLSRNTQVNHAEIAARLTPFGSNAGLLRDALQTGGHSGLAALNAEVTRQAGGIAFLNDFHLMMLLTLAAIPLLALLRPPRHMAAAAAVAE